jgi:hypothetical protein
VLPCLTKLKLKRKLPYQPDFHTTAYDQPDYTPSSHPPQQRPRRYLPSPARPPISCTRQSLPPRARRRLPSSPGLTSTPTLASSQALRTGPLCLRPCLTSAIGLDPLPTADDAAEIICTKSSVPPHSALLCFLLPSSTNAAAPHRSCTPPRQLQAARYLSDPGIKIALRPATGISLAL